MRQCNHCGEFTSGPFERCPNCKARLPAGPEPRAMRRAGAVPPREEDRLRAWLAGRPRDERQTLMLHYADGLTVAEIAAVLDLGTDYVRETPRLAREQAQELMA